MNNKNYLHSELTYLINQAFFTVYNSLGFGFLERVHENAMIIELANLGLSCERQCLLKVFYNNLEVGHYFADIVVENKVIIELKAAENLCLEHEAQLVNYLRASKMEVGVLLNFGKTPQHKKRVLTAEYKNLKKS